MKVPMPESNVWKAALRSRLSPFSNLIFAGLVKNAGKTTALNAINALYQDKSLGLTSIGYDGEAQDAIYHHPKPSISVRPGQLILTSERFLPKTTKGYEILDAWGQHPQFGAWLILRIITPGDFQMAGPSARSELLKGISRLRDFGAAQIHVDGAFNRLSHISINSTIELGTTPHLKAPSSGIILSTGAALGNTLLDVVERTQYILELFQLPAYSTSADPPCSSNSKSLFDSPLHSPGGSPLDSPLLDSPISSLHLDILANNNYFCHRGTWVPLPSFLWNQDLKSLIPSQIEILSLKGALTDSIYFALRAAGRLPQEFITRTPAHIMLSPDVWNGLKSRGIRVRLLERPNLLLLTLSPWHPLTPIPTELLAEALLPYVKVPLVDIQKQHLWIP